MGMVLARLVLLSVSFLVIDTITLGNAQNSLYHFCEYEKGNYTTNSTYQTNLNTLLSNLSSNTDINYGFYNFSNGQSPDRVNAIGLCRGDVEAGTCRSCLNQSRVTLTEKCPNQKEAVEWYDNCMLRYSNRSIFGRMETSPAFFMWNLNNATSPDQFNQALRELLEELRSKAASGDSYKKYAAANTTGPDFQYIYASVQCTPDLTNQQCTDCLIGAFTDLPNCCPNKRGGRVVRPSCNFRYENYRFYTPTFDASPPPPPPPSTNNSTTNGENGSNTSRTVIIVAVSAVAFLVLAISICIFLRMKRKPMRRYDSIEASHAPDEIKSTESLQFDFARIREATNNFSDANKLGQGGFGSVYKGTLSSEQDVAVKRLSQGSGQGDTEFKNEVLLVAKLQHRNLVRLLGFCLEGSERLLIYEFVPNKSLDYFIFDPTKRGLLDWEKRYKIIGGTARGLLYLHEDSRLRIIHRDLKASNILLDEEMNPKISDFGMARLFVMDQTQGSTSRIVGTYGYMAPEYAMHGYFSVKSDVFSFGVLILEIVSGQKNSGFRHGENIEDLLSFAWKSWREGTASSVIDPTLNGGSRNEIMRCIHIGLLCVQENVADRPTMASVVLMLNSYSLTLPVPSQPAFFMNSRSGFSDFRSVEYSSDVTVSCDQKSESAKESVNDASITELYAR